MSDNRYFEKKNTSLPLSDLACERRRADIDVPGVTYRREEGEFFTWERIQISSLEGEKSIGRPSGNYDTLSMVRMDLLDEEDIEDLSNEIAKELCYIFDKSAVTPERILIVGLGNPELTPDSVGPKSADLINATMHLRELDRKLFSRLECSEIAVFSPGVMAKTGIESTDTVCSICEKIMPDAVIAIDAIASRSPSRLGTTIQVSDTGIFPGSGIGNRRKPLNQAILDVPVIAIGVPTVINARNITSEDGNEQNSCVSEDMFVSPREIDSIVSASSKIISRGINQAFGIF